MTDKDDARAEVLRAMRQAPPEDVLLGQAARVLWPLYKEWLAAGRPMRAASEGGR